MPKTSDTVYYYFKNCLQTTYEQYARTRTSEEKRNVRGEYKRRRMLVIRNGTVAP